MEPTVYETTDPHAFTLSEEFFGPLLTVFAYDDSEWDRVLPLVDSASPYALTLSVSAPTGEPLRRLSTFCVTQPG